MRKLLSACLFGLILGGTVVGSSSRITITPPAILDPGTYFNDRLLLQSSIDTAFGDIQNLLNSQYFSKLHDLVDLSRGFANANALASHTPEGPGFENYDLFDVQVGTSLGLALPGLSPAEFNTLGSTIAHQGDVYAGLATGGVAGHLGWNASSFLLDRLSVSVNFGVSNLGGSVNQNGETYRAAFHQSLFGIGARYDWIPPWSFGWGLLRWGGVSLGIGLNRNSETVALTLALPDQVQRVDVPLSGKASIPVEMRLKNLRADLQITADSWIIPWEVDTSLQLFWFLNLGLGAGVDLSLPHATVTVTGQGDSSIVIPSAGNFTTSPAGLQVTGSDSHSIPTFFDLFAPHLTADLGLQVSAVKIDFPVHFYPATQTFTFGVAGGVVW